MSLKDFKKKVCVTIDHKGLKSISHLLLNQVVRKAQVTHPQFSVFIILVNSEATGLGCFKLGNGGFGALKTPVILLHGTVQSVHFTILLSESL